MKDKTSETPDCAAFPILWLNAGAQITHGGQVQRPRESLVMYVVLVSSANVISRRPPTLQSGFLLTVSTPCMRNYQRQCHTPPPGADLNCFPRRLQPIVTLFYRHCHGCWLTATLNWTTIYRSFLEVYPPLPLTHLHYCTTFPASNFSTFLIVPPLWLLLSEVCRRKGWKFYCWSKIKHLHAYLLAVFSPLTLTWSNENNTQGLYSSQVSVCI